MGRYRGGKETETRNTASGIHGEVWKVWIFFGGGEGGIRGNLSILAGWMDGWMDGCLSQGKILILYQSI